MLSGPMQVASSSARVKQRRPLTQQSLVSVSPTSVFGRAAPIEPQQAVNIACPRAASILPTRRRRRWRRCVRLSRTKPFRSSPLGRNQWKRPSRPALRICKLLASTNSSRLRAPHAGHLAASSDVTLAIRSLGLRKAFPTSSHHAATYPQPGQLMSTGCP